MGQYFQSYHRIWVNQPPLSPSWNIPDTSVLTQTQSVVIIYVFVGLNNSKASTLFYYIVLPYWLRAIYFGCLFPHFRYIRFVSICHYQFNLLYYLLCLMLVPLCFPLELDIDKYVFGTSSNFDNDQSNSCCFLLSEVKFPAFLRHQKVASLEFLNMLIIKINCSLYSGLVMK